MGSTDGEQTLTREERAALSNHLLAFLEQLQPLLARGFGAEVAESRAERLANGDHPSISQGPFPGRNALETAMFSALAGLDHARLAARSVSDRSAVFGVATLTRGALEALARARWIIEPEDDRTVIVRWLSALASELKTFDRLRPGVVLHELRGRHSDASLVRESVLDDLERLKGDRHPIEFSYSALAASLATRGSANGRVIYSDLSGVARAESLSLHGFLQIDERGDYRIALTDRWAVMCLNWMFTAASRVGREMLSVLGQTLPPEDPCVISHDAAARAIAEAASRVLSDDLYPGS